MDLQFSMHVISTVASDDVQVNARCSTIPPFCCFPISSTVDFTLHGMPVGVAAGNLWLVQLATLICITAHGPYKPLQCPRAFRVTMHDHLAHALWQILQLISLHAAVMAE